MLRQLFLVSLLFVAVPATVQDQDPLKLFPKNYQLELENDYVRVIHVKYGAHEKTPMHGHPVSDPVLIVALTDENIKFTLPDDRVIVSNRRPGEASGLKAVVAFRNTPSRTCRINHSRAFG